MKCFFGLLFCLSIYTLNAQDKRICILGSSTSFGYGMAPGDSYADKLKSYYKSTGQLDTLYNLAQSGSNCYMAMPGSYVPPPGRYNPNPAMNITRAVHLVPKPDVIIVNFPTNAYDWLPVDEILCCLQTIKDSAEVAGINCYITTTQPRADFNQQQREKLRSLKDSIISRFGFWSIDFWNPIVQDPPIVILPQYSYGDGVHVNAAGHTVLANQVIQKNFFIGVVACRFGSLAASKLGNSIRLKWDAWCSNENFEIQKSADGIHFSGFRFESDAVLNYHLKSQETVDDAPYNGKNFYRIKILSSTGSVSYSPIVMMDLNQSVVKTYIFPTSTSRQTNLQVHLPASSSVAVHVASSTGNILMKMNFKNIQSASLPIDMSALPAGIYFINLQTNFGRYVHRVVKE